MSRKKEQGQEQANGAGYEEDGGWHGGGGRDDNEDGDSLDDLPLPAFKSGLGSAGASDLVGSFTASPPTATPFSGQSPQAHSTALPEPPDTPAKCVPQNNLLLTSHLPRFLALPPANEDAHVQPLHQPGPVLGRRVKHSSNR